MLFPPAQGSHELNVHLSHELMGRSLGVGALEIFTHNLQDLQFFDNFVPTGAPRGTHGQFGKF